VQVLSGDPKYLAFANHLGFNIAKGKQVFVETRRDMDVDIVVVLLVHHHPAENIDKYILLDRQKYGRKPWQERTSEVIIKDLSFRLAVRSRRDRCHE
jgi:hypothetical protein